MLNCQSLDGTHNPSFWINVELNRRLKGTQEDWGKGLETHKLEQ